MRNGASVYPLRFGALIPAALKPRKGTRYKPYGEFRCYMGTVKLISELKGLLDLDGDGV